MNQAIATAIANIPSIAIAGMGCFLAYKGIDEWGWFLLIAALISVSKKR